MAPGQKVRPPRNSQPSNCPQTQHVSTSNSKKVRGKNKSKGLERLIKKAGHPLNLNISVERRPIGENHELLSREIGIVTRYHAPIKRIGWNNFSEADKEPLYELLKMKFNLDLSEPHVKGCLELLFSSSYKTFHHRCYTHYLKSGGGDSARNSPYEPLRDRPGDWTWLCDHFETEEFQKKSVIGRANRMKLANVHKKGTKPFVALQHELSCDQISLYKECYCSDKGWASRDARHNYETMLQMQHENEQEGAIQLTEQQICEKVLGKAYGYIRGRSHGPKPNRRASSTSANTYQQMEEELAYTKQTVAVQQNQLAVQQNQLESQQKQLDWLRSVVSKLAGIPPPAMDDNDASGPSHTTTTSIDGSGSLVSDGMSRRS